MSIQQINFPTTIRFGAGAIKEVPDYLSKYGLTAPLIVTDHVVATLPFFKGSVATTWSVTIRGTVSAILRKIVWHLFMHPHQTGW